MSKPDPLQTNSLAKLANLIQTMTHPDNLLQIQQIVLVTRDVPAHVFQYVQHSDGSFTYESTTPAPAHDFPADEILRDYMDSVGGVEDAQWGPLYGRKTVTHEVDGQLYEIAIVEVEGGGEGDGEYCHLIFRVTKGCVHNAFVKIMGYYQSYSDTQWNDEYRIVHPTVKVTNIYE